jgi:outer membrane lipoprotein-sorting protein
MKKIRVMLLTVLLISSMLFAGCGGSDSGAATGQSEPAGETEEKTTADTAKADTEGMGDLLSAACVDLMKSNEYLMEYKFTMEYGGQTVEAESTLAKKGDDMAVISDMSGIESTMIFKGDKMYMVDHNSKTVTVLAQENGNAASMKSGSVDMEGAAYLGTGKEDGLVYEEYSTDGGNIKYYFSGKDLVKMAFTVDGQTMMMEILELSKDVPASMFEIPPEYQVIEM